jgi:methionine-rich copper-binding protein CopC
MVHCHNLPHEDHDMMSQFSIGAISYSGYDPHHPIDGARPSVLSAPAPPVIGTAAPSNASALVRWSPPVDDGGWAITGYLVRAFASTVLVRTQAVTGDVASVVVTGLANTTAYTFDVAAINAAGTGAASDRSTAVTPRTEFIAPVVTARTPAAGARSVSQTSNVTMTFSEPVTGVTSGTFVLRLGTAVVPAAVTYNATTRVATLDPTVTLQADRVYGVSFSGIRDTAGNLLAPSPWSFTTGPAPTMTATTPASGATAVRRNNNVTATFSEAITGFNTTTVRITRVSTGAVVPSTVAFNPTTRVLTINPGATLAASAQYRVTITGGTAAVRDLAGNPLVTRTWVFTTGTAL